MVSWTLWRLRWTHRRYAKLLSSQFPLKCKRADRPYDFDPGAEFQIPCHSLTVVVL
jgi:hypothetical protein